jgi:predicted acyl esterase
MGDDWFHYGAFRQPNFDYFVGQTTARGSGGDITRQGYDDYENFRRAGSAGWSKSRWLYRPLPERPIARQISTSSSTMRINPTRSMRSFAPARRWCAMFPARW